MTLKIRFLRCLRRWFIILVSLTSAKMLISTRCIHIWFYVQQSKNLGRYLAMASSALKCRNARSHMWMYTIVRIQIVGIMRRKLVWMQISYGNIASKSLYISSAETPHRPKRWGGTSNMAGIICPPWSK